MILNSSASIALPPTEESQRQRTVSLKVSESTVDSALQAHVLAIRQHIDRNCSHATLLTDVRFEPVAGGVRLSGTVRSYYLRQILLSFVMRAATDVRIIDQIQILDWQ